MSTEKTSKINQLLRSVPTGTAILSSWLTERGYNVDLQKRYRNSNWLESIGTGAMIRKGDEVGLEGALYALQQQAGHSVHPGGRSAMGLLGKAHFLEMSPKTIILFGSLNEKLPSWFWSSRWGLDINYYCSDFLPAFEGLTEMKSGDFTYKISGPVRAMLECLYLVPQRQSLLECYEIMEGLNNLRPSVVQSLLEKCGSVKVKRLFLYLADKADHQWFNHIKPSDIDLGSGKRSIIKGGAYNTKYEITVDRELEEKDEGGI